MNTDALKALADENRLAIVHLLAERGELCVCEVATSLELSDALVSHHLGKLREAGLVNARRVGRWQHISIDTGAFTSLSGLLADLAARAGACMAAGDCCCAASTATDLDKDEGSWP